MKQSAIKHIILVISLWVCFLAPFAKAQTYNANYAWYYQQLGAPASTKEGYWLMPRVEIDADGSAIVFWLGEGAPMSGVAQKIDGKRTWINQMPSYDLPYDEAQLWNLMDGPVVNGTLHWEGAWNTEGLEDDFGIKYVQDVTYVGSIAKHFSFTAKIPTLKDQPPEVPPSNPTATISADSTRIMVGQSTTIRATFAADTAHGDTLTGTMIDQPEGMGVPGLNCNEANNKNYTFTPTAGGAFIFYARASSSRYSTWTTYAQVTVQVDPLPTVSISASPVSGTLPLGTTLTWTSTNATSVDVSGQGVSTTGGPSGSTSVTLNQAGTFTYTATAHGPGGNATSTCTVTVYAPPTVSITPSPASGPIPLGTTLTWTSTNATSVDISGQGVWTTGGPSGNTSVTLNQVGTFTYTATAYGPGGTATATCTVTVNAAPTVTLSASPASGAQPLGTTLTWSSTNATSVDVSGQNVSTTGGPSGSTSVTLNQAGTFTYTATAHGPGGNATSTCTVTVYAPPTVTLSPSPAWGVTPLGTTLSWSSTNATSVDVSGQNVSTTGGASGSTTVTLNQAGTFIYTATAHGPGGTATTTCTVTTVEPPTVSISASPASGQAPMSTTLNWSSTNANSVDVTGSGVSFIGASTTGSGYITLSTPGSYTYTAKATGSGGTATSTCTVTVTVPPPPVVTLTATPTTGFAPLTVTLNWTSQYATSVSVNGTGVSSSGLSGSAVVTLNDGTYTYVLNATGLGGSSNASSTVIVNIPNYTITTSAVGPGSVTSGGVYPKNTGITLSAIPTATGRFMGWTGDTELAPGDSRLLSTNFLVIVNRDKFLVANFASKLPQSITFPQIGVHDISEGSVTLNAAATSGLPITYTIISGPGSLSGNRLSFSSAGTIVVRASQGGNATFLPAADVDSTAVIAGVAKVSVKLEQGDAKVNQSDKDDNLNIKVKQP